jgi:hypothetical protein
MIKDRDADSAIFEDLRLIVVRHGEHWRASVEEIDDPNSRLSDGTDYRELDQAKRAAVTIARDLFGTDVPEHRLEWLGTQQ